MSIRNKKSKKVYELLNCKKRLLCLRYKCTLRETAVIIGPKITGGVSHTYIATFYKKLDNGEI